MLPLQYNKDFSICQVNFLKFPLDTSIIFPIVGLSTEREKRVLL